MMWFLFDEYFAGNERAIHGAMWHGSFPNHIKLKMQGNP